MKPQRDEPRSSNPFAWVARAASRGFLLSIVSADPYAAIELLHILLDAHHKTGLFYSQLGVPTYLWLPGKDAVGQVDDRKRIPPNQIEQILQTPFLK